MMLLCCATLPATHFKILFTYLISCSHDKNTYSNFIIINLKYFLLFLERYSFSVIGTSTLMPYYYEIIICMWNQLKENFGIVELHSHLWTSTSGGERLPLYKGSTFFLKTMKV